MKGELTKAMRSYLVTAAALFMFGIVAPAATINLVTTLGGPTSTGASTTGTGMFNGVLDTSALTLSVNVSFSNLTSPTGGPTPPAHIHRAGVPGGTGPVIVPFPGFPSGVTSGTYSQLLNLTTTQFNNLAAALGEGTAYVNVHSVEFPAGEIRGNLPLTSVPQTIPEPSTAALLIAAGILCCLMAAVRRSPA